MQREFKVDKERVYDFHKRFLKQVAKVLILVFLFIMAILLTGKEEIDNIYFFSGILIIMLTIAFAGVMAATGGSTFKAYEKTRIVLEENGMIRIGDGLMTSRIDYKEIGSVFFRQYGIVVIKKGIFPFLKYYLDRYPLRHHQDIIFIPYLLEDYEVLHDFLLNKKYMNVDKTQ